MVGFDKVSSNKYLKNCRLLALLAIFMCSACSQIDEETQAKIVYWEQQASIMTLLGPQKEDVFAWVYAIDSDAKYSGDRLVAKLETLTQVEDPNTSCILLSIRFDEKERVRAHYVTFEKHCD
jgi:hypothetical protein